MKIDAIHWQDALPIRHQVLWPDKSLDFCSVAGDETANHYGVHVNGQLVCVASIYIDGSNARLRKFATLPSHQGKGIGSQVIAHIIDELKGLNIRFFWCDARTRAVGFYQKFGLTVQGEEFKKSDVAYNKMVIELNK